MNNNTNSRRPLSKKEEQIMCYFWQHGALFVRELLELLPEPRPHINTISTFVRSLEAKGWLKREQLGNAFRYFPTVKVEDARENSVRSMIDRFFNKSYLSFVSTLVKEEKISTEELRELIDQIEQQKNA